MARMTSSTALAAPAAQARSAAAQYTSVAPVLYRAALGTVNVDHYLAAFERLDTVGRVLPGWNLAAALCPLGWLLFRRLWLPALWVGAALALGALLLWTVGWQWLAMPLPMLAGLALAGLLVLCGGLGLYGDALVHADVRRRIVSAVSAAPNLRDAVALLERRACSRRRLAWVAGLGAALVLSAALAWLVIVVGAGAQRVPEGAGPEPQAVRQPRAVEGDAPAASGVGAGPVDVGPDLVGQPQAVPSVEQGHEPAPDARPAAVQEPASRQAAPRTLYINVGLFADPENARRTHARLQQAGLPSSVEPVVRADGRRLQRVRVGPFGSAAQANAAAAKVRAMGLETVAGVQ